MVKISFFLGGQFSEFWIELALMRRTISATDRSGLFRDEVEMVWHPADVDQDASLVADDPRDVFLKLAFEVWSNEG